MFQLYRDKITKSRIMDVGYQKDATFCKKFLGYLTRIFIYGIISGICAVPALFIKLDMVGSPLIIMFVCIIIPGAF